RRNACPRWSIVGPRQTFRPLLTDTRVVKRRKAGAEKQLFNEEPYDIANCRVNTWTVISFSTLNKGICTSLFSVPIVSVRGCVKEGLNFTLSRRTRVGRAGGTAKRRLRV